MSFWTRRKRESARVSSAADTDRAQKAKKSVKRSPPVAMEVKIVAIEALGSGLSVQEPLDKAMKTRARRGYFAVRRTPVDE